MSKLNHLSIHLFIQKSISIQPSIYASFIHLGSTTAFRQKISSLEEQVRSLQQDKVQLTSEVSDKNDQLHIAQNQLRTCLHSKQTSHNSYEQARNQNNQFRHSPGQWEQHVRDDGRPNIHNKQWPQKKTWQLHNNPNPNNSPGTDHNLVNNRFDTQNVPQIKHPSTTNDEEGEQPVLGVGADEEKQEKPQNPDLLLGVNHDDNRGGNQNNRQDNDNQETDNNKDKQTSKEGGAGGDDAGKDYQTDDHQGEPKKEVNPQDEEGGNNDNTVNKDNPHQHIDDDKQPIEDSNALHKEDFDHIANLLEKQKKVDYAKDDEGQEHDRLKRQEPGAFGGDHGPNGRHNVDDLDLSKFLNKPFDKMPPGFQNLDANRPGFGHGPFDPRQFPGFQQNPGYEHKPYDSHFKNPPPGFFGDGRSEDEKQLELPMEDNRHQNEDKKPYDRQLQTSKISSFTLNLKQYSKF